MEVKEPCAEDSIRTKLKLDEYSYDVLSVSQSIFALLDEVVGSDHVSSSEQLEIKDLKSVLTEQDTPDGRFYLRFKDIRLLHKTLKHVRENEGW